MKARGRWRRTAAARRSAIRQSGSRGRVAVDARGEGRARLEVILDRWGGEQPVTGSVRCRAERLHQNLALGVEEQRVRVIVDFTSPREAWARLAMATGGGALRAVGGAGRAAAATSALFRQGEGWAAFVIDGNRARLEPVEIGQRAGWRLRWCQTQGRRPGVAHPDETIRDGVRVKPR